MGYAASIRCCAALDPKKLSLVSFALVRPDYRKNLVISG